MNKFVLISLSLLVFLNAICPAESRNCDLKEKINRAIRELPLIEDVKDLKHSHGHIKPAHSKRSAPVKRPNRDTIPQLARNIESFLQKVIPNHSLIQDLMGYITMPNPNANGNKFYSNHK